VFKKSYGDVGVSIKGSYSYTACDIFTLIIGNDEDPIVLGYTHTANGIFGTIVEALFKRHF